MSDSKTEAARAAASTLLAAPTDLGAWLDLGDALDRTGRKGQAVKSFQALGEAASALGSVALAAACARWLIDHDLAKAGDRLAGVIARTHGKGSKVISTEARPAPPVPPPSDDAGPASAPDDADKAVDQALAAAVTANRKRAPSVLLPTPLVSGLDSGDLRELIGVMALRRFPAGGIVIEVGQPATALYWIARGSVEVSRGDHRLGELYASAFFGEIALVGGTTRTARVAALEPTWLIEIPAEAIEKLAGRAPKLASVLASHARSRLLANVMRTSELFARLGDSARADVLPLFETKLFEAGQAIVTTGADNDHLFVLAAGSCEVREAGKAVATLVVGDGIGEMSLLARKPATADVIALERTVVLALSRATFDQIAVKHPALLAEVYRVLVERERENAALVHDANDLII